MAAQAEEATVRSIVGALPKRKDTDHTPLSRPVRKGGTRSPGFEVPLPELASEPAAKSSAKKQFVVISAPNFQTAAIKIRGAEGSAYVQHAFSEKARKIMEERMAAGTRGKNTSRTRAPRDFESEYRQATHFMEDGSYGIPAASFRNAMISACSVVGYAMTKAKMTIFILADGHDRESGMPMVRLHGKPDRIESTVSFQGTTSTLWRPIWRTWSVVLRVKWDADQFSAGDVLNLCARAGLQVGVGEGRPFSKNSAGVGWGMWEIES